MFASKQRLLSVGLVSVRALGIRPKGDDRVGFWASLQINIVSYGSQGGCCLIWGTQVARPFPH